MSSFLNDFNDYLKGRIQREIRKTTAQIEKYDFKSRIEKLIESEIDSYRWSNKAQMQLFKQQYEIQLSEVSRDPVVLARVQAQIDKVIEKVLSEERIRDITEDWIDDWVDEIAREQLEIRLNAKIGSMLDTMLDEE